jgi:hypothetical protein
MFERRWRLGDRFGRRNPSRSTFAIAEALAQGSQKTDPLRAWPSKSICVPHRTSRRMVYTHRGKIARYSAMFSTRKCTPHAKPRPGPNVLSLKNKDRKRIEFADFKLITKYSLWLPDDVGTRQLQRHTTRQIGSQRIIRPHCIVTAHSSQLTAHSS